MTLLIDTHVFLWWRADAPELGHRARTLLADHGNEVVVSAVVGWEIVIKRGLGRLEFAGTVEAAVAEEGFRTLPVTLAHVDALAGLPPLHRDPFDRLLIAQAQVEGFKLVTHDDDVAAYPGIQALRV